MATHNIDIALQNTQLGTPATADGVMGMICKGVVASGFALDTFYLLTKLADLDTLGIDAAYDTSNNVAIYQQVSEFYAEAGDGAKLWIGGVSTATIFGSYVLTDTFKKMITGTESADPLNMIKWIGLCYNVPAAEQHSTDFPIDVTDTLTGLQATLTQLFAKGYHVGGVIDGANMSSTITPTTIETVATQGAPSVNLCITGTKANRVSSVGQYLGRLARITVGTSAGRVEDGKINCTSMYLTNAVSVLALDPLTDFDLLGSKQFLFARTLKNYSGFYWNDDATCDLDANSLSRTLANRVANKLADEALAMFLKDREKNMLVTSSTGDLDPGYCAAKSQEFKTKYIVPLITGTDLSDGVLVVSGVGYSSTKIISFKLRLVQATPYGSVEGEIAFQATI
jgi:hypothetical protein